MKDRTMSNHRHVLKEKEKDYKGIKKDHKGSDDEKIKRKNKHSSSSHSHKNRRSSSPHESYHRKKSPLKSKIGYDNSDQHRSQKHRNAEENESYEELSRRKRKLESELRALDLEEAAQKEADNKKARKERSDTKREARVKEHRSSSRSDNDDKKSLKSKAQNVAVKEEKDKGHSSKSLEDEKNWGRSEENKDLKKEKPNLSVSGKLTEETNTYNGVVIKYNEPLEARKPKRKWRLYPFKGDADLPFIPIHRQSAYLFGRTRLIADIPIDHPSCSKQHAVLQHRLVPFKREDGTTGRRVRPYIIDLESSNGTYVNNQKIDPRCYVELIEKDVVKFGYSSREYVILHEESKNDDDDDVIETND